MALPMELTNRRTLDRTPTPSYARLARRPVNGIGVALRVYVPAARGFQGLAGHTRPTQRARTAQLMHSQYSSSSMRSHPKSSRKSSSRGKFTSSPGSTVSSPATAGLATVHSFGGGVLGPSLRTRQMATLPDE
eukprot:COSAG06_NODE_770_length_12437_cov_27.452423_15_plen_133_part_00